MSLPKGWTKCLLGDYLFVKNGFAFKSNDYLEEGTPVIRISDIKNQNVSSIKSVRVAENNVPEGFELEYGDLLIAMSGATTGKTGVYLENTNVVQNQRVGNIKLKSVKNGNQKFRNYLIQGLSEKIFDLAYGGAQPNISPKVLENIEIPLPPLNEQKRIAKKLDELLSSVESIKTRLDNAPIIIKRFRQSILSAATSGKLTEVWREENGIVDEWENLKIDNLLEDIRYGTSKKCSYDNEFTPVLRIPNISDNGITTDDVKYAQFNEKELTNLSLKVGDILVIRSNGSIDLVGKNVVVTEAHADYLFAGYLIRMRFDNKKVISDYVHYVLSSPQIRGVLNITAKSTSGVNNVNSKELGAFPILLPTLKEQKEIVSQVESLFALADTLEEKIEAAKKRVNKLTQSILAKAFRGKLVKQDPNDESAEKLLQRIKNEKK